MLSPSSSEALSSPDAKTFTPVAAPAPAPTKPPSTTAVPLESFEYGDGDDGDDDGEIGAKQIHPFNVVHHCQGKALRFW